MDCTFSAIVASWSLAPWLALSLALSGAVYLRGWLRLRRRGARQFGWVQLVCFIAGLATIGIAVMSPLDALAPLLMQAHMVQHLLLMIVACPLLLLAAPELPMISGLPAWVRHTWVAPLWQTPELRRLAQRLTQPMPAWLIAVGVLWFWHVPAMYEWTLRNRWVHDVEHVSFLLSSLLFWWPVLLPYPHRRTYSIWLLLPYLFLAGLQGSILSGLLTFSDHVLYPHYEQVPRLWNLSAVSDQAIGGAIMWTIGSLAYLIPLVLIGRVVLRGRPTVAGAHFPDSNPSFRFLAPPSLCGPNLAISATSLPANRLGEHSSSALPNSGSSRGTGTEGASPRPGRSDRIKFTPTMTVTAAGMLPVLDLNIAHGPDRQRQSLDLLRVPVVGRLLRSSKTRVVLQSLLFALAVIVVLDGWLGPQVAPLNLAGVGPWIYWRWLLVIGLLAAGNLFCMACPFTLLRKISGGGLPARWDWPKWLSNKGPAIGLLVLFFCAYELFALWDSPWWTAWIAIAYFAAATAINGMFRGAPFCRYVCPIGQFNFVYSLISPLEVAVRNPATCASCQSQACLRGRDLLPGCEMGLLQPAKQGNLDCTFCLDCVRACPHENVGLIANLPAARLACSDRLDGGRPRPRASVTLLIVVLTAAAFVNAAWMIASRAALDQQAVFWLGAYGTGWLVIAGSMLGLLAAPLLAVGAAALLSRRGSPDETLGTNAARYAMALVPLGIGMWGAHYTFHLLTAAGTIVTATWRWISDLGLAGAAPFQWRCPCCSGDLNGWLLPSQFVWLDLGLLASLYVAYVIARRRHGRTRNALAAAAPWTMLLLGMFVVGVVLLLQPMQMRSAGFAGRRWTVSVRLPSVANAAGTCRARLGVLALAPLLVFVAIPHAMADGGTVQFVQNAGVYRVTLMSEPAPLRVGMADLSVMVQTAALGQIMRDERLVLTLRQLDDPPLLVRCEATSAAATNKLLRSAQIELPRAGTWYVHIELPGAHDPLQVDATIAVADQPPRWRSAVGWMIAPVVPIGLFVLGEVLAAKRDRRRKGPDRLQNCIAVASAGGRLPARGTRPE